jgi:tetratricopeptide (TPR) repeat protein
MAEDTMFQDAVEALKQGNKARAKELLTLLLKTEQTNATYWVWMSAAVDNQKERVYCLQTALNLEPANVTAKRGLILLGALPPDETIQPFPLNRPRAWEEKLLLAHEQPKPKGMRALTSNPVARLAAIGGVLVLLGGLIYFGLTLPRNVRLLLAPTITAGPSPTYSPTPTLVGAVAISTPTFSGPTPLWAFLDATYTPTPFYVNTPRPPQSADQYRVASDAFKKGDIAEFIRNMEEVARLEPTSPDVYYLIGDAYLSEGMASEAGVAYNKALKISPEFGPAYLGLARAGLLQNPGTDVTALYNLAIKYDPNFGEIYLDRGNYYLNKKNPEAAIMDFGSAEERMPTSPMVYYGYAQAYEMQGDTATALKNAEKAFAMDITLVPNYLLRGRLYLKAERYTDAIKALNTYVIYEAKDKAGGAPFALLGEAYYKTGDYKTALPLLNKGLTLDPTQRQVYLYRAFSLLETGDPVGAQTDFERAIPFLTETFEIKIGLTRSYYAQEKFGSAYLEAEGAVSMAKTDEEKALAFYWRAFSNEGRGYIKEAVKDWQALLKLPASVMTAEMRTTAEEHLRKIALMTPSATTKPSATPTKTSTPAPTSVKKTPTPTRTPTQTPTP